METSASHPVITRRVSPGGLLRRFAGARTGATSVEFAIVAVPFFGLLFAIIETAFSFFASQSLQTALDESVRKVLTGQVQSMTGMTTPAQFRDTMMCDPANRLLPAFMDCSQLSVDIRTVANFASANTARPVTGGIYDTSGFTYNPGAAGSIVVARAVYPMPVYVSLLGTAGTIDLNGRKRILIATSVFRNEPF